MVAWSLKAGPPFASLSQASWAWRVPPPPWPALRHPGWHSGTLAGTQAPWLALRHPGRPGRARDGTFTALLLLCSCPVNPHRAPQTLREKARPFLRNGFLHLYNVIGAVEKRGRWIYGNYIKFMESWQARSREGLQNGGGYFETEKFMKEHQTIVSDTGQNSPRPRHAMDQEAWGKRGLIEQLLGMLLG